MVLTRDRLRYLRDRRGLLQAEVAQKLNMPPATYSSYENGSNPKPEVLIQLAQFFDTTTDYLLGATDEVRPSGDKISTAFAKLAKMGSTQLTANDIVNFVESAMRYCRAGRPCGDIPLIACQQFVAHLATLMDTATTDDIGHLVDEANEAIISALEVTKMPAAFYKSAEDSKGV